MAKTFRVVYESKSVKALRDPSAFAQRIHLLKAKNADEAASEGQKVELRHAGRLLADADLARAENRSADAKFLDARADLNDWKLKSVEEVK